MDHLTLKNPVEIQVHPLVKEKEVLSSAGLFGKHEGKSCHIQSEWKGIHLVGTLQAGKKRSVKGN